LCEATRVKEGERKEKEREGKGKEKGKKREKKNNTGEKGLASLRAKLASAKRAAAEKIDTHYRQRLLDK
jgi:hypothetical protein